MEEIGTTTREVGVEAWIGMIVIVIDIEEGTEIIVVEVGVVVTVLIIVKVEAEIVMKMTEAIVVDLLTVPRQDEVQVHEEVSLPLHAGVVLLVVLAQGVGLQKSATSMKVLRLFPLVVVELKVLVVPDFKNLLRSEVGTNWKWLPNADEQFLKGHV